MKADPHAVLSPMQLLGYVTDQGLVFTPGTRYDYSDSDNIVAGLMIEAVTHGTYESALADDVTDPLHLASTTLPDTPTWLSRTSTDTTSSPAMAPEDVSTYLNPGLAWASGGMLSTPAELNRFMRAYVRGTLTDRATRAKQFQFVPGSSGPPGPGTNSAGLAVFRYRTALRDGLRPYRQFPRLHPLLRGHLGRDPLGDGHRQRAAQRQPGHSGVHPAPGGGRRGVCAATGLTP